MKPLGARHCQIKLFDGRQWHECHLSAGRMLQPRTRSRGVPVEHVGQEVQYRLRQVFQSNGFVRSLHPGSRVTVICDDYTRPTPADAILPVVLDELNRCGVPDRQITLLVSAGHHREMTSEEKLAKYGREVCQRVAIVHHFSTDAPSMVPVGVTETGIDVRVNRLAVEADLTIGIGLVEIHPWAGFAGGGKILNPGVAAKETIDQTHQLPHDQRVRLGRAKGNPFWQTSAQSARLAKLAMVVNLVLDLQGRVCFVAVGDPVEAQLEAIGYFRNVNELLLPEPADIVVTTAYPKHQQWGQAAISLYNAGRVVKTGGVRISVADCPEGLGDCEQEKQFYHDSLARDHGGVEQYWLNWLGEDGCHSRNTCAANRHLCYQQVSTGVLVTENLPEGLLNQPVFRRLEEALDWAFRRCGPQATVAVIDKGGMCLATVNAEAYHQAANSS